MYHAGVYSPSVQDESIRTIYFIDAITRAGHQICSLHDGIPVSDKGCVTKVGGGENRELCHSPAGSLPFSNNLKNTRE